jgi:uncharacterized protein
VSGSLAVALVTGLLGGFGHCAVMCGPLVGAFGLAARPRGARRAIAGQLAYHAGRITTYALLGGLLGLTGSVVNVAGRVAGVQEIVAFAAGLLMIGLGLGAAGLLGPVRRLEARLSGRVARAVHGLLGEGGTGRLYPVGLALGFLPCGLSWSMLLGSAATGSLPRGLLLALVFGLGTIPALLLVGGASALLSARARGLLFRAGGLLVALLGALFLLRGLGVPIHAPL